MLVNACESWTVSKQDEKRLRAFEMKAHRRILGVSWKEKKTNEWIKARKCEICGYELEGIVKVMKKRKFKYSGHVVRGGGTARAVMEGGMEGKRERGRPRRNWMASLREWSGERSVELRT